LWSTKHKGGGGDGGGAWWWSGQPEGTTTLPEVEERGGKHDRESFNRIGLYPRGHPLPLSDIGHPMAATSGGRGHCAQLVSVAAAVGADGTTSHR
jgi:hypothetical protein